MSPFFDIKRFQALSSPQISETDVADVHQPVLTRVPQGHQHVPSMICDICVKPHKRLNYKYAGSKNVEYLEDMDAFEPIKCLCYNCIYNERRDDVLPPKPDDL